MVTLNHYLTCIPIRLDSRKITSSSEQEIIFQKSCNTHFHCGYESHELELWPIFLTYCRWFLMFLNDLYLILEHSYTSGNQDQTFCLSKSCSECHLMKKKCDCIWFDLGMIHMLLNSFVINSFAFLAGRNSLWFTAIHGPFLNNPNTPDLNMNPEWIIHENDDLPQNEAKIEFDVTNQSGIIY